MVSMQVTMGYELSTYQNPPKMLHADEILTNLLHQTIFQVSSLRYNGETTLSIRLMASIRSISAPEIRNQLIDVHVHKKL